MVVISPLRRGIARLLAATALRAIVRRACLGTFLLLRLLAEELMFQVFDFPLEFLVLPQKLGFSLLASLVLGFPIAGLLTLLEQFQQQLRRVFQQVVRRGALNRYQACAC
jgi:hypothetical protein